MSARGRLRLSESLRHLMDLMILTVQTVLCHCLILSLQRATPTDGFYKTLVKYGKLGGEFTFCGKPFKKPLMMITAGSSFKVKEYIKLFYGRMVEDIAPAKPEVVHYGYAFSVPTIINV